MGTGLFGCVGLFARKNESGREADRRLADHRLQPLGHLTAARKLSVTEISDIVALREIPAAGRNDLEAYAGCVSGAALIADVEGMLRDAGFENVRVNLKSNSDALGQGWSPGAETLVASALIRATQPREAGSNG